MIPRLRVSARSEAGFTLMEMLVCIAVLGIIMVPFARGMFFGYNTMSATTNRAKASLDSQFLTTTFPNDVASAESALTTGISCTGVTGTAKLQLKSVDNTFNVVYGLSSTTPAVLTRYVCTSGAASSPVVLARDVKDSSSVTVTVTGSPFTKASMTVTEAKAATNDVTNYSFTVTGSRRAT